MRDGSAIQSWHVGLRGDMVMVMQGETSHLQGAVMAGVAKEVRSDLYIDFDLLGQFSKARLLGGPFARLRWRPIESLEVFDLAVAASVTVGKIDPDVTLRSGLGGEVGITLPISDIDARIAAGIETGFLPLERRADWALFAALSIAIPFEQDRREEKRRLPVATIAPPVPVIETKEQKIDPKEEEKILLRALSIEAEDQEDYVQAYARERRYLELAPEEPHHRLLSLFMMKHYKRHGNFSGGDLYATRPVLDRIFQKRRSSDVPAGIRLFQGKTQLGLAELPERAAFNVLIVLADLMELLNDREVQAAGVLTRERFMRHVKDRYFSSTFKWGRYQPLPMITDGLDLFATIYAIYLQSEIQLTPDLYNDFGMSVSKIIKQYEKLYRKIFEDPS